LNFNLIEKSIDFAESLKLDNHYFTYSMTTNGILLDKYMDFLAQKSFKLLISLDGDETANGYRVLKNGKPAFKIIINNIEKLRDRYPQYFEESVNFNAVLHNMNSVPMIFSFFNKTFNKIPRIAPLNTSGIKPEMHEEFWETYSFFDEKKLSPQEYSALEENMFINLSNIQELSNFIHYHTSSCYKDYYDLIYRNPNTPRLPTGTCIPFSKKIFITVKGMILPCERVGNEYSLGKITSKTVQMDFNKIAHRYNHWFELLKKQCQNCYRADYCSQCIFQLSDLDVQPKCNGFFSYTSYSEYLKKNMDKLENNPKLYWKIFNNVVIE